MRALMITKFVPFPDNSGGRQRSLAIARRLAEHFQLTLCAYSMDDTDATVLASMGIDVRTVPWHPTASRVARGLARTGSITAARFWTHELVTEVRRAASEGPLELLQVECLQMSPLARGLQARCRVLDLENVESSLVASYAQTRSGLRCAPYYVEARALRRLERSELRQYDIRVVVAEPELSRLPGPARTTLVCPNGREPTEILAPARSSIVAFVATMGWAPNVDAAVWFAHDVWPIVCGRVRDAKLLLVGRDPSAAVRALASDTIEVTGTVPDVGAYLAQAEVAVAPLRSGGGTRLKILEALQAGRPVVATSIGADGLEDLIGQGLIVADSAVTMAESIVELLHDPDATIRLGTLGHEAVISRYGWDVALGPLVRTVLS